MFPSLIELAANRGRLPAKRVRRQQRDESGEGQQPFNEGDLDITWIYMVLLDIDIDGY